MKKILNYIILVLIASSFLSNVGLVFATDSLIGSDCPSCAEIMERVKNSGGTFQAQNDCEKYCTGDYQVNDFVRVLIRGVDILFGLIGSLTLLMFIYGGIMFLVSSGSTERITKARTILINAIIGLIIIFTSYLIIQFVLGALGYDTSAWFTTPK